MPQFCLEFGRLAWSQVRWTQATLQVRSCVKTHFSHITFWIHKCLWNDHLDEIQRQLTISGAKGIVTSPQFIPGIKAAQLKSPNSAATAKFLICIGQGPEGSHSYSEMIKTNPGSVTFPKVTDESSLEDTVMLPFSSGTTGLPKGVCLTHFSLLSNLIQAGCPEISYRPRLGSEEQQRLIGQLIKWDRFVGYRAGMFK